MAQHDYVIDNQGASPARADLNNVFQAIMSMNSGATAPSTTVANMFWYDTANDLLKMRNETNTGWITLGTVNQSTNNFESATVNGKTVGTLTAAGGIAYATSTSALAAIGAGTSGQVLLSGGAGAPTWTTPIISASYVSSNQTITPAGLLSLAHSLGAAPKLIMFDLICTTAEYGFSIGDVVVAHVNNSSSGTTRFNSVYYDATNINIRYSNDSNVFCVANKTTGNAVQITAANWRLRVRAFA